MTTFLNMVKDINGVNAFGLPLPDDKYATVLTINTAQSLTVPTNSNYYLAIINISAGSTIWVANNQTAALPGGSFATTTSVLNPPAVLVKGGDVLSIISGDPTGDQIGVSFYALNL